jgi:hypothetical protein
VALAGNSGTVAADKAAAKAKALKKKPVATGSRGDSGTKLVKPTTPKLPGPPTWPKKVPVRPGAQTNRFKSEPTTQAQRTHVHNERIKRNKQLAPEKYYKSQGASVEKQANEANAIQAATKGLKGRLAKDYARKNPDLFKPKGELKKAGFTPDVGVKLTNNSFKDLLAIGQTPVSTYHLAEPTVKDLAKGDVKGAGKEAVKAGKQIAQPYVDLAKHPRKSFMEHPVFTGLMVAGAEGAVGRAAGAAGRSGALGATAKSLASTEKVTKIVPGTSLKEIEKHSPDVIRKGVAVGREKYKGAKAYRKEKMQGVERVPVDRMHESQIKKRVDERLAANEDIRRQNRDHMVHEVQRALKGHEHSATSLLAQGVVKADHGDLHRYIGQLAAEHPNLSPAGKFANAKLRKELQKVADNPKVDLAKAKRAGEKYASIVSKRTEGLIEHNVLNKEQSDRAVLMSHATANMGAKHDGEAMVTAEGKPLTTKAMLSDYNKFHGLPEDNKVLPAYVSHKPRSRGDFNQRSERPVTVATGRTGASVRMGTLDTSHEAMVSSAARVQGVLDAVKGFKGIADEFSVRDTSNPAKIGQWGSRKEAIKAGNDMRYDANGHPLASGHDMVPYRLNAIGGSKHQLESLINDTKGDAMYGQHSPLRQAIHDALNAIEGDGPWGLMPKAAADRIQEHLNTMGRTTLEQGIQASSSLFRKTVLSTSPTWLWGNVAEAGLRSAIAGAGPLSYRHGIRVLKQLEKENPELAQIVAHRVAGGGHFSSAVRQQVFKSAEQFHGTKLYPLARAIEKAGKTPGPREIAGAWHQWSSHVFRFNSKMEQKFQTAMFGKALKRDGMKAIEDAVNGMKGTESQVRLGRMVDDMYGQYSKWSPSTRYAIATYTPFLSWWLAAAKFVFHVLPRDHPVTTALLASANVATEKWRREQKIELNQLGLKAGFLAGTVPGKGGTHTNIARFSPFGAFTSPSDIATTILPQISAVSAAAKGTDWKGHQYKTGKEGLVGFGNELAGAYVPGFQRYQSAKKYGPVQSVNPYRAIAPGKKKTKKVKAKKQDILGGGSGVKMDILGHHKAGKIDILGG